MTLCFHNPITTFKSQFLTLPANPTAPVMSNKATSTIKPHHIIISATIKRCPLSLHPRSNDMLTHDGEWFSSLFRRHVSHAEWDNAPLSFYHLTINGGAIKTTYRLVLCPRLLTAACLRHPTTVRSTHPRSNGP